MFFFFENLNNFKNRFLIFLVKSAIIGYSDYNLYH